MAEKTSQQPITLLSKVDSTIISSQVTWLDLANHVLLAVTGGGGKGRAGVGVSLLFDLEVLVGGVFVAVDLHVGYVSLLRGRGDGSGLFHLAI